MPGNFVLYDEDVLRPALTAAGLNPQQINNIINNGFVRPYGSHCLLELSQAANPVYLSNSPKSYISISGSPDSPFLDWIIEGTTSQQIHITKSKIPPRQQA